MDILAAKLVEVQLRGSAGNAERLISAHLAKLTRNQWFNIREAERHLLLLEDLPGFDVRLMLKSAATEPQGQRRSGLSIPLPVPGPAPLPTCS